MSSARKEEKEEGKLEANPTPSKVLPVPAEGGSQTVVTTHCGVVLDLGLAPNASPSEHVRMVSMYE